MCANLKIVMHAFQPEAWKKVPLVGVSQLLLWTWTLGASLATGPALGAAPPPLSMRQMEALSPEQADRRVREDLLSLLQPVGRIERGHVRGEVDLVTAPFATAYPGLCRRDVLELRYAPTDSAAQDEDQPMRPYGLEAKSQFVLRGAAPVTPRPHSPRSVWGTECAHLSKQATGNWFDAPNEDDAARAVNLFDAALTRLRAGTLSPCASGSTTCSELRQAKALRSDQLLQVFTCKADVGTVCYDLFFPAAISITLVARDRDGASDISPADVVSVGVGVYVD
jgi:hypothetical protein